VRAACYGNKYSEEAFSLSGMGGIDGKMIDIEEKLETIISEYGLETCDLLKVRLSEVIGEILQKEIGIHGRRIVVRGLKYSAHKIHPFLELVAQYGDIVGVVDKAPFAEQVFYREDEAVPILAYDDSLIKNRKLNCDIYLINSLYNGKSIYYEEKTFLEKEGIRVIDLYKEMRIHYSICVGKTYEEYTGERDFSYNRLQKAICDFRVNPREDTFKRLVSVCLSMRDFISLFAYIEEGAEFVEKTNYWKELIDHIVGLLNCIQKEIEARYERLQAKDVMMHWIDQLGYDELNLMPRVSDYISKGLTFCNAITVTPYTKPTARMMFWKDFRVNRDNNGGKGSYEARTIDESSMYKRITEKGFHFGAYGYIESILYQERGEHEMCEPLIASALHYWRFLRELLLSDKPVFGIIHMFGETHEPYLSPESVVKNYSYEFYRSYNVSKEKIKRSAAYADRLIEFYTELLGKKTVNIYMSDHGKWEDIDRRRYKDESMHTLLGITNLGIQGEVERMFSYEHFDLLVDWILKMASQEEMFFCDLPIYSTGFKSAIIERGAENTDICQGYTGIKTNLDKYIRLESDQEYYFVRPDEEHNRIEEPEYQRRIQYLRMRHEELKERAIITSQSGYSIN